MLVQLLVKVVLARGAQESGKSGFPKSWQTDGHQNELVYTGQFFLGEILK